MILIYVVAFQAPGTASGTGQVFLIVPLTSELPLPRVSLHKGKSGSCGPKRTPGKRAMLLNQVQGQFESGKSQDME